jgi:hypothetical protein
MRELEEKAMRLDRAESMLQEANNVKIQMSMEMGKLKESIAVMGLRH